MARDAWPLTPSPQRGAAHLVVHASSLSALPSSQSSPRFTTPSPHRSRKQTLLQPSFGAVLPSSHSSGARTTPSPHAVHNVVHPSWSSEFPSSHSSPLLFRMPSPQYSSTHWLQPSPATLLPSSHSSSMSTTRLPHAGVCTQE